MFSAWGDSVGYGPEPEEVINLLRRHEIPELMGNHELSLVSDSYFKRMNPSAQKSISITRTLISGDTLGFIERLPACSIWHDTRCVHGCPPDSITRYLFDPSPDYLKNLFQKFTESICFYGHTHNLGFYELDGSGGIKKRVPVEGGSGKEGRRKEGINRQSRL